MSKLERVRILASHMSIWVYSVGIPPPEINQLFLNWVDRGKVPTLSDLHRAIAASNKRLRDITTK